MALNTIICLYSYHILIMFPRVNCVFLPSVATVYNFNGLCLLYRDTSKRFMCLCVCVWIVCLYYKREWERAKEWRQVARLCCTSHNTQTHKHTDTTNNVINYAIRFNYINSFCIQKIPQFEFSFTANENKMLQNVYLYDSFYTWCYFYVYYIYSFSFFPSFFFIIYFLFFTHSISLRCAIEWVF